MFSALDVRLKTAKQLPHKKVAWKKNWSAKYLNKCIVFQYDKSIRPTNLNVHKNFIFVKMTLGRRFCQFIYKLSITVKSLHVVYSLWYQAVY